MRISGFTCGSGICSFRTKALIAIVFTALIFGITAGFLLVPAFGESVEALGGNGGLDETGQVDAWTLVDDSAASTWGLDTTSYQGGTGAGKLDSPEGPDTAFNSYVYYRFTTSKVPEAATLDLAYKKLFTGAGPASGDWILAAELWEVGGTSPLQEINIDAGSANVDFTVLSAQTLTGITKMNTQYELRLVQKGRTGTDQAARLTAWFDEVRLNVTYDSTPPLVISAASPTDRSVDVVFDETVDKASAETAANYSIDPAIDITTAALQADGKTVRLTTDVQTRGTDYTVSVNNLQDISANAMTGVDSAVFTGVDTTPPAVVSAVPSTDKTVDVKFSEPVEISDANTVSNYEVTPALVLTDAVLQADGQTVRLTTGTQTLGTDYLVAVTGVRDLANNAISGSNTAVFTGIDSTPPQVVSTATVNDTTVSVSFNELLDAATSQNVANYSVSPSLAVNTAVLQPDGKTVHFTTARQSWQTTYTVTVSAVTDTSGNVIDGGNNATFSGTDTSPPEVTSATPVDDTTVDVLFNEPVDSASAQTLTNYSFSPALSVNSAVLQADGQTLRLSTAKQAFNTLYTVTVTGVADLGGNIISGNSSASFNGTDSTAPEVSSASALDYQTVDVIYSEKVDSVSAQAVSNYSISPALTVTGAALQADGLTVRLTTGAQTGGMAYAITVTGVKDIAGNTIGANNMAGFAGTAPPSVAAPKVLSASAPDNTAVLVVFSTTMDPLTAQVTANYSLSPELAVTGAILQQDGVTVRLSTAEQTSGMIYTVTVSNVTDQNGNMIGAAGNKASFTGNEKPTANPHGRYVSDTNQCAQCHVTHNAQGIGLIAQQTQTQLCYLCHDAAGQSKYDVAGQFGNNEPYSTSHHKIPEGTQQCSDCHNPHDGGTDAAGNNVHWPRLLQSKADGAVNGGNQFCFSCHQTEQGNIRPVVSELYPTDGIGHNNSSFIINGVTPMNPASGTDIRCMGCHERHGSELVKLLRGNPNNDLTAVTGNNKTLCLECHTGASADNRYLGEVVFNNPAANPHALTSSTNTNVSYPGVDPAQAGQCVNCHDPHGTANGTSQVMMKTLRGTYNDGKTTYTAGDFSFCYSCHNNTSANSNYDIQTQYNAPGGGHIIRSAGGSLVTGSKLACQTCHSLHGSANNNKYMLNDSLGSNLGDGRNECLACHRAGKTVEGIPMSAPSSSIPEHTGTTTPCLNCHGSPHMVTKP